MTATGLERFEIEKIKGVFMKYDNHERGFIMKYELDDVLKSKIINLRIQKLKVLLIRITNRLGLQVKRWWHKEVCQSGFAGQKHTDNRL